MLPFANAIVTKVTAAGQAEDYDEPASAGSDRWTGTERAYYQEKTERVQSATETDILLRRLLYLDSNSSAARVVQVDDTITVNSKAIPVKLIRLSSLPGHPMQTTLLMLEDG